MNTEIKTRIEMINKGEVPEGYKKTKVGIIPEDWKVNRLNNVIKTLTDYVANGSFASLKENVTYREQEDYAILLRLQDYSHNYKKDFVFIDKHAYEFLNKSKVYPDDIIISNVGARCGLTFKAPNLNKPMSLAPNAILLRTKIVDDYVCYWLSSELGQRELNKVKGTSAQPKFNKTDFRTLEIFVPPLSEQQKIAQILSTWDEAIELKEKLIEEKKEQKKGLMQKLLTGEVRLPGFDGEWEEVRLGKVLKVKHGKNQQAIENENGKYPILGTSGIIGKTNCYLYDKPSVLIGRKGTIDRPQYIEIPFWTIDTLFYTQIQDNVVEKYIYYLFTRINWYSYNEASGVPSLNARVIEKIKVHIPSFQEQKAIAQILTTSDKEIELLNQELQQLKLQKKGLMQLLLTGIIRVKS